MILPPELGRDHGDRFLVGHARAVGFEALGLEAEGHALLLLLRDRARHDLDLVYLALDVVYRRNSVSVHPFSFSKTTQCHRSAE